MPLFLATQCCGCLCQSGVPLVPNEVHDLHGRSNGELCHRLLLSHLSDSAHTLPGLDESHDAEDDQMGSHLVVRTDHHPPHRHRLLVDDDFGILQLSGCFLNVPVPRLLLLLLLGVPRDNVLVHQRHHGSHPNEDVARIIF